VFRTWSEGLPSDIEVCPVQLPGRGSRLMEPPFRTLSPLIRALAIALLPMLDKPFAFFGHSLGALVSFELTRELRRQGLRPAHLFVSASSAPHLTRQGSTIYDLSEEKFLEQLRRLNGTPEEVLEHFELRQIILPLLRADFSVYETYAYSKEPPLDCPISTFGGSQDHKVNQGELEAWRQQTSDSFSLQMFPGDHFFVNTSQSPLLWALSRRLRQHVRNDY